MIRSMISVSVALLLLCGNIFAANPLTKGTALMVRITNTINSRNTGAPAAVVESDVKDRNGNILISRGTPVMLSVESTRARSMGRPGSLNVRCIATTAVDGQQIMLDGSYYTEGVDNEGLAIGLGVGLGLTFLPGVGFAFFAIKGEEATIAANNVIPAVFVLNDYMIE